MVSRPAIKDVPLAPPRTSLSTQLAWGVLLMILIWSWQGADMRPIALVREAGNMATL